MAVVLITGSSSGFGLEAALAFARRGDVVIATMRNLAGGGRLAQAARAESLDIEVARLDVAESASFGRAVARVVETQRSARCAGQQRRHQSHRRL